MPARYVVVGTGFRTWTGTVRDRLLTEDAELPGVLHRLRAAGLSQALWLSTCDRVEVVAADDRPAEAALTVAALMAERAGVEVAGLAEQLYTRDGPDAVGHVFAVAASLDSQVPGEPHVLGQVKTATRAAVAAGMVGAELDALMRAAFAVAKRVRTETTIAERPTSIAAAAVDIAWDLHGDLGRRKGLLIGGGDMGLLMVERLRAAGLKALTVTMPADGRAEAAARRLDCHYAPFAELDNALCAADIVVTAVGLGRYILTEAPIAAAVRMRRRRPVFIVDAALPTDVEPSVGDIEAAFVYDLADLERVALQGRVGRGQAAAEARALVDQAVAEFVRARIERTASPVVIALRRRFEAARRQVLLEAGVLGAEEATRRLVNRLLHDPSEVLRRQAADGEEVAAERLLRDLFRLDETTNKEDEGP
ncbi:MAG: glutamyl-tRNA reductase [Rhodospirillaceae bacterium]